jgi:O-antigen/teichoic acid export membrane protein
MVITYVGAFCFGLVVGWVTYRTLRRRSGESGLSDIATVIGAVGGAAVTSLFKPEDLFAAYAIGLAIGFFAYFIVGLKLEGKPNAGGWMID